MALYDLLVSVIEHCCQKLGIQAYRQHHLLTRVLLPGTTVVDIGGNLGEFSQQISAAFQAKCYVVEAVPKLYAQISATELIQKFNVAISSTNAPISIYLAEHPECNSIKSTFDVQHQTQEVVTVEGVTLDSFLDTHQLTQIDLLKVDIEGAEDELFKAVSDTNLRQAKQITMEFHDFVPGAISTAAVLQIIERLRGLGFYCLPFSYMLSGLKHADVLFINTRLCQLSLLDWCYLRVITLCLQLENFKAGVTGSAKQPFQLESSAT